MESENEEGIETKGNAAFGWVEESELGWSESEGSEDLKVECGCGCGCGCGVAEEEDRRSPTEV